jgi:prophage regulatory protein
MPPKRFIRRPELVKKVGLCATTIYNLERAGQFPKHFMLSPRCAAWDESAVEVWMAARAADPAIAAATPDPTKRRGVVHYAIGTTVLA